MLADVAGSARRAAQGKAPAVLSPICLEAVQRIDALFDVERDINGQDAQARRAALLRGLVVNRPNQVWCADITYIPMRRGFLYLVAVMDWATRKVLAWRVSNTMDVAFCVEALQEALAQFGRPEIFNTDQGSQFTSAEFTDVLRGIQVRISMDGRGRWMDNVFIERLWRSLKYECVYLHAFETGSELRAGLTRRIGYYNARRPHSTLGGRTPDEAYGIGAVERLAA